MPHRKEHLEATLQRVLGQLLTRGLADPRVKGMISVTGVTVTPDGEEALVKVSVLPGEHAKTTVEGLKSASHHLRVEAGRRLETRRMPTLRFEQDDSLKKQAEVLQAIQQAVEEDRRRHATADDDATDDDRPAHGGSQP